MAKLKSISNNYTLIIRPLSYEEKDEGWISTEIVFKKNNENIFRDIASFLQEAEFKEMQTKLKDIVDDKTDKYEFSFIEPNFELGLMLTEKGNVEVSAAYMKKIEYEEGEIKKNFDGSVMFITNKDAINDFVKELDLEIKQL